MSTLDGKTIVIDGVEYRLVAIESENAREVSQRNIVIVYVNGKALHLVFGKSREEWERVYANPDLWDVPFEELVDGTLEVDEDIWYWYIDGRCFETNEKV
jgi:hypothetical protein